MPSLRSPRLAVVIAALVLPSYALAAQSTVSGSATVDGDAANTTVSEAQRTIDLVDVRTSRSWIRQFTTTWTDGARFQAVTGRRARRIATLETLRSKNVDATATHDFGAQGDQGTRTLTELWISAKHGRTLLTLKPKLGLTRVSVTLRGGAQPRLNVAGLPAGTFRVTFTTEGSVGSSILLRKNGCSTDARPVTARTTAMLAGGATGTFITEETSVVCDGAARPVASESAAR